MQNYLRVPLLQRAWVPQGGASEMTSTFRLRKHADFQRVYKSSSKQFSKRMSFFFSLRELADPEASGPRVGLTVGKVMGKAVDRNRIKRRLREAVRRSVGTIAAPVDIVLHPRRTVIDMEFAELEREVAHVFGTIRSALDKQRPDKQRRMKPSTQVAATGDAL